MLRFTKDYATMRKKRLDMEKRIKIKSETSSQVREREKKEEQYEEMKPEDLSKVISQYEVTISISAIQLLM